MDNLIKIQSEQGSFDTSGSKNLVDINIPGDIGVINLRESYININTKCDVSSTADPEAVFNSFLALNGSSSPNQAWEVGTCIVRNASAYSSKMGKIEDVKRCDVVRTNLAVYEKSSDEKLYNLNKLTGGNYRQQVADSPQNELPKIGSVKGRSRDQDIYIPLSEVFGFCNTENYDTNKMGATRLHFECNFNHLSAGVLSLAWANVNQYGVANSPFGEVDDITLGADRNFVITTQRFEDLQESPFFVGQQLDIERTKDANPPGTTTKARITKIEYEEDESKLKITLSKNWSDGAGTYTAIKLKPTVDNGDRVSSVNINGVELVAHINSDPEPQNLIFSTMMAQEDQFSATATSFNRTYDIPANVKNVYLMFNNSGDAKILSESDNLTGYRLTVDNEELVNREVKINSPLHFEQIQQVMMNNGKKVGDLRAFIKDVFNGKTAGSAGRSNVNNPTPVIVMAPYPFKAVPSKLNVELNGSNALGGNIIVFSEVVKTMN